MNDRPGDEQPDREPPSKARIVIWVVVAAIGLYLVGSGVWGLLTNG